MPKERPKSYRLLEFGKPRNHGGLRGQDLIKEMGLDTLKYG